MAMIYNRDMNPGLIDLYHELLAEFDSEDIAAACKVLMKSSKWFPRPSEIIETIRANQPPRKQIDRYAGETRHAVPIEKIRALADKIGHRIKATKTEEEREARLEELAKQGRRLKVEENGDRI
jgi:ABC-type hemin transport system substrate-binding protein